MRVLSLTLLLFSTSLPASASVPAPVAGALSRAASLPGSRVEVLEYRPSLQKSCVTVEAEISRPIAGSGRVALKIFGKTRTGAACTGWAFAKVQVFGKVLVTARALRTGEILDGALSSAEREVREGHVPASAIPSGAVAARPLRAGAVVDEQDLRMTGPRPGDKVTVELRAGGLSVVQVGRAVACVRGRACALLPSGKRVEGTFADGRIVMEAP